MDAICNRECRCHRPCCQMPVRCSSVARVRSSQHMDRSALRWWFGRVLTRARLGWHNNGRSPDRLCTGCHYWGSTRFLETSTVGPMAQLCEAHSQIVVRCSVERPEFAERVSLRRPAAASQGSCLFSFIYFYLYPLYPRYILELRPGRLTLD
jgi:hypothetical protein